MIRKSSLAKGMFSTKISLAKGNRSKTGAAHPHKKFFRVSMYYIPHLSTNEYIQQFSNPWWWCIYITADDIGQIHCMYYDDTLDQPCKLTIGIDHDTVCAGVGGTAIRHSTSCAGRRAAACGRAGRHNECCAWWQYHPRQRRPYKWSISILPRSQFYKKQGKLAFSTSCTAVRPHRRLRNDAWRRDS